MKAIVTGATGFIGKELVQTLVESGIDVIAIVRNMEKVPSVWKSMDSIQLVCSDLSQLDYIRDNYSINYADYFYHLGWYGTSGIARMDIQGQLANVDYACKAVQLSVACRCKTFVNAGSIMEYEVIKLMNSGDYVPALSNAYSTAKLTANYMARILSNELGVKYVNVIISNIYGVGEESSRFLNTMVKKMMNNEAISLTHANQLYDFIYIKDATRMICEAGIQGKNNESYYVGNKEQRILRDFLVEMRDILGSESKLLFGAVPLLSPTITFDEFDTSKVERELGVIPEVSFREGILKLIGDYETDLTTDVQKRQTSDFAGNV